MAIFSSGQPPLLLERLPQGTPSESLFEYQWVMVVHQDLIAGWPVQKLETPEREAFTFLFEKITLLKYS